MANLNEILEVSKRAQQLQPPESDDLYAQIYQQLESLKERADIKQDDLLINWAISLANHHSQTKSEEQANQLFDAAQQKYGDALQASVEKKHLVLYNWGNLLLDKGESEVQKDHKDKADELFTEARSKYEKALELKDDYIDALHNLSRALSHQGQLKDGNSKFWFVSQAAEKDRRIANLKAGTAAPVGKSSSPEEKLQIALKSKEKGNEFFKTGDLSKALYQWYTALNYVNGLYGLSKHQEKAANELKLTIYNNMATAHIKQGKHDKAIAELNKVLEIDSHNVKALFRRGKAYLADNDLDRARIDLERVRDLVPEDKDVKAELALLSKKEKAQETQLKSMYTKMF